MPLGNWLRQLPKFWGSFAQRGCAVGAAPVGMASGITAWQGFVAEVRNLLCFVVEAGCARCWEPAQTLSKCFSSRYQLKHFHTNYF